MHIVLATALRKYDKLLTQRSRELGGLSEEMQKVHDNGREALALFDRAQCDHSMLETRGPITRCAVCGEAI